MEKETKNQPSNDIVDTIKEKHVEQSNSQDIVKHVTNKHAHDLLMQHNYEPYDKMIRALDTNGKALMVHATGTGKTYLALQMIKNEVIPQNKKVLFVAPKNVIIWDFTKLYVDTFGSQKCLTTSTYTSLAKSTAEHYDYIILDEAHHVGAYTWNDGVNRLLANNPNAKVLALTATPEREDGKNVSELLNVQPTSVLRLADAIYRGVLPKPQYICSRFYLGEDLKREKNYWDNMLRGLEDRQAKAESQGRSTEVQKIANLRLLATKVMENVINANKNLPNVLGNRLNTPELKHGKYIVFCPRGKGGIFDSFDAEDEAEDTESDELSEEEDNKEAKDSQGKLCKIMKFVTTKLFKNVTDCDHIKVYPIHSVYSDETNKKNLDAFKQDKSTEHVKLLFAVDMLNEGKHIDDVDGIIMLRRTSSKPVFYQQIGRAVSAIKESALSQNGNNKDKFVFDLVSNYHAIKENEYHDIFRLDSGNSPDAFTPTLAPTQNPQLPTSNETKYVITMQLENIDLSIDAVKDEVMNYLLDTDYQDLLSSTIEYIKQQYSGYLNSFGAERTREAMDYAVEQFLQINSTHSKKYSNKNNHVAKLGQTWFYILKVKAGDGIYFTDVRRQKFNECIREYNANPNNQPIMFEGEPLSAEDLIYNMFSKSTKVMRSAIQDAVEYIEQLADEYKEHHDLRYSQEAMDYAVEKFLSINKLDNFVNKFGQKINLGTEFQGMKYCQVESRAGFVNPQFKEIVNKTIEYYNSTHPDKIMYLGKELNAEDLIDNMFSISTKAMRGAIQDAVEYIEQLADEYKEHHDLRYSQEAMDYAVEKFLSINMVDSFVNKFGQKINLGTEFQGMKYCQVESRAGFVNPQFKEIVNKTIEYYNSTHPDKIMYLGKELNAEDLIYNMFSKSTKVMRSAIQDAVEYIEQLADEYKEHHDLRYSQEAMDYAVEQFLGINQFDNFVNKFGQKINLGTEFYNMKRFQVESRAGFVNPQFKDVVNKTIEYYNSTHPDKIMYLGKELNAEDITKNLFSLPTKKKIELIHDMLDNIGQNRRKYLINNATASQQDAVEYGIGQWLKSVTTTQQDVKWDKVFLINASNGIQDEDKILINKYLSYYNTVHSDQGKLTFKGEDFTADTISRYMLSSLPSTTNNNIKENDNSGRLLHD